MYNLLAKSAAGSGIDAATETFTYDVLGRILTVTKNVDSTTVSENEFAYNAFGGISDADETLFSGTKREFDHTYEQSGRANSIG